jgi:ABC-2 type transport system ATP-binding protein
MNNILELRGLRKSYGTFSLDDISFEMPAGYIMGFVGPNGAGKTTTIKAILNVIRCQSGNIKLFGDDIENSAPNERLGVVMDSPFYVDEWTVKDVERALSPFYTHWDAAKYADCIQRFGIDSCKKVKDLSRGMKVKLQLAVALSHNADLLILDEPTSGLDPVSRDEVCDILREFIADANKAVLFSTHITTDLEKVADYITFILDGRIVFTGTKDALLEKYARITGGLNEINGAQRKHIIGYREHGTGFEGMIETAYIRSLPNGLLTEPITLEEIIIFMNKASVACEGAEINE